LSIDAGFGPVLAAVWLGWGAAWVLNALADRWAGRSTCGRCGWTYPSAWPTMAWFLRFRGRCPGCGARLMVRPPLVEAALPALFALAVIRLGATTYAVVAAGYLFVLLLISVVDLATRRIPNVIVLPAAAVALGLSALGIPPGVRRSLIGGVLAFGLFLAVYGLGELFLRLVSRGKGVHGPALGAGDVKLALFIGLAVGYPGVVLALFLGAVIGAVVALGWIVWRLARGRYRPFAAMAYGPYLALGAAIALLWG